MTGTYMYLMWMFTSIPEFVIPDNLPCISTVPHLCLWYSCEHKIFFIYSAITYPLFKVKMTKKKRVPTDPRHNLIFDQIDIAQISKYVWRVYFTKSNVVFRIRLYNTKRKKYMLSLYSTGTVLIYGWLILYH